MDYRTSGTGGVYKNRSLSQNKIRFGITAAVILMIGTFYTFDKLRLFQVQQVSAPSPKLNANRSFPRTLYYGHPGQGSAMSHEMTQGTPPDLGEILEKVAGKEKRVLLVITDSGFMDMSLNLYYSSISRFGITNYLFATTDKKHCHDLHKLNINCFVDTNYEKLSQNTSLFMSTAYVAKTHFKSRAISQVLELGYDVLLSDSDITYLKNPLLALADPKYANQEIVTSADSATEANTGFSLYRNTPTVKELIAMLMEKEEESKCVSNQKLWKELIFNTSDISVKMFLLPQAKFMTGCGYYGGRRDFASESEPLDPGCVTVHQTCIGHFEGKRYRMKESGFWNLDTNGYYSSSSTRYITYKNTRKFNSDHETYEKERTALKNALYLAEALNRTLILPKFNCRSNRNATVYCNLLARVFLPDFDHHFPNYREHEFLNHHLVPETIKNSRSAIYCIDSLCPEVNTTEIPMNMILGINISSTNLLDQFLDHLRNVPEHILQISAIYGSDKFLNNADYRYRAKVGVLDVDVMTQKMKAGLCH